jgi:hypothetical protein
MMRPTPKSGTSWRQPRRNSARAKFDVLCIEGSWGDTLSDRMRLRLLSTLNRTGSMYAEVIYRV